MDLTTQSVPPHIGSLYLAAQPEPKGHKAVRSRRFIVPSGKPVAALACSYVFPCR